MATSDTTQGSQAGCPRARPPAARARLRWGSGAWSGLEGGAPGLHARFDGLPRTQPLEVTVVLAPGGNELDRVLLDGRRVALTGRRGREPVLPGSRLELRSLAPLRVIELVVEGRLLP